MPIKLLITTNKEKNTEINFRRHHLPKCVWQMICYETEI